MFTLHLYSSGSAILARGGSSCGQPVFRTWRSLHRGGRNCVGALLYSPGPTNFPKAAARTS